MTRFEKALCSYFGEDNCMEIEVETYEYENGLMTSACLSRYTPSALLLGITKYTFGRDEEGYLSTFMAKELYGDFSPFAEEREKMVYKIKGKRK